MFIGKEEATSFQKSSSNNSPLSRSLTLRSLPRKKFALLVESATKKPIIYEKLKASFRRRRLAAKTRLASQSFEDQTRSSRLLDKRS
jgi:hypothetical protein